MTVLAKNIIPAGSLTTAVVTKYTAIGVTTIVDRVTATNYAATAVSLSVYIVPEGSTPTSENLVVKTKTLQPAETYTCPEMSGQVLPPGAYISASASANSSITLRGNGREVS